MNKTITAALGVLLLFALTPCGAWAEELLVGGQAVGIEIEADGVLVSGFCRVETAEGFFQRAPLHKFHDRIGALIIRFSGSVDPGDIGVDQFPCGADF